MNTIDRVLLSFLILLLPVGLLVSHQILTSDSTNDEVVIDAEKLKVMVDNYSNMQVNNKPKTEIVVANVSYASESGVLSVSGDAPSSGTSVLMSVTVLPPKPSPSPSTVLGVETKNKNNLILGRAVETYSIDTKRDGGFVVDYQIEGEASIVEIRFEQDDAVKTIRFDVEKKEQIINM